MGQRKILPCRPFLVLLGSFPVASGSIKEAFGRLWELVRAFWEPW